jgi:hypothetical protein
MIKRYTELKQPDYKTHVGSLKVGDRFATSPTGGHTYWDWIVVEVLGQVDGMNKVLCRRCNLDGSNPLEEETKKPAN